MANLGGADVIKMMLDKFDFHEENIRNIATIIFTNYLTASILMPYDHFLQSAIRYRYDIELLMMEYRVSYEQVCQRLTTLNHPEASKQGIPFHFIKIDRAGNIAKRFSLSGLPIPRFGTVCPRWNIFESFAKPGEITVGTAILPNDVSFLTIASAILKGERGHRSKRLLMAIGLGCDIKYAHKLVYSDRLNIQNTNEYNPIGVHCRICERQECADRVFPYHKNRSVNPYIRGVSQYG